MISARFDTQLPDMTCDGLGDIKFRVGSERPAKRRIRYHVIPIVADDFQFSEIDEDGKLGEWKECLSMSSEKNGLPILYIVRNNRELWSLRSMLAMTDVQADCLEEMIDEEIDWISDPDARAAVFSSELGVLKNMFGFDRSLHKTFYDAFNLKLRSRVERSVSHCVNYDRLFFHAQFPGNSEAYVLKDTRPDRKIILLDFNSMFPYGTQAGNFSTPSKLKYVSNQCEIENHLNMDNPNGLFHVVMKLRHDTPAWFRKHHPFKKTVRNLSVPVEWTDESIETLLHANEILFFRTLVDVQVFEGVFSDNSMDHPLASTARALFKNRRSATSTFERSMWKKSLLSIHACMNAKHITGVTIHKTDLESFFSKRFASRPFLSPSPYFNVAEENDDMIVGAVYRVNHPRNIYSLMSQALANARVRLFSFLSLVMKSTEGEDVSLCYSNIDSLHFSIPKDFETSFDRIVETSGYFGLEMGQLKEEARGTRGLWLDVGRYWIFDKCRVVYYRGSPSKTNPFKMKRVYTKVMIHDGSVGKWKYSLMSGVGYWSKISSQYPGDFVCYDRHPMGDVNDDDPSSIFIDEKMRSEHLKIRELVSARRSLRKGLFEDCPKA